jgi:hypothetical protein
MSQENQNVIDVIALTDSEIKDCLSIAESANGARGAEFTRDGFIRTGSDKLVELVGTKPDWAFLKQVQGQTIQFMINEPFNFASDTADVYFSYILKDAIGRHKFVKPTKDTTESKRINDKREKVKKDYGHISLENVTQSLLKINQKMAQDILNNKAPKKEDKLLSSELKMAQDMKLGKVESEQKANQKSTIGKYKNELDTMLKIDTGRTNKKGNPIFEYSLAQLEFAHYCLKNQAMIKKLIADKK